MEFLPKPGKAKSIQIDIDPARMGCGIRLKWVSPGDCRSVLRALIPMANGLPYSIGGAAACPSTNFRLR
jgi:thiamine pyrophosphate-dependent acetolactate synthase large subunit-like protein